MSVSMTTCQRQRESMSTYLRHWNTPIGGGWCGGPPMGTEVEFSLANCERWLEWWRWWLEAGEALLCKAADGIVVCRGPTSLCSAATSGVRTTICLSDVLVLAAAGEAPVEAGACVFLPDSPNPELDDWSRVLTTSSGHVKIAPIVPPVLKCKQILKIAKILTPRSLLTLRRLGWWWCLWLLSCWQLYLCRIVFSLLIKNLCQCSELTLECLMEWRRLVGKLGNSQAS